jgi:hypothetical protein
MATLRPGDVVKCRTKDNLLVSCYSGFDAEVSLQIIAVDEDGHYVYIPDYLAIKETFEVDAYTARVFGIKNTFIGSRAIYILPSYVVGVQTRLDGMTCAKCSEFFRYAEANQEDESFVCFTCRNYYWWSKDRN